MSLLGDTIRDAHRPLQKRAEERVRPMGIEESREGSPGEDQARSGQQSLLQFQKEGQPSPKTEPREASSRSGALVKSSPAGDPLSVESAVERPSLFISDVNGNEGIFSVKGDNQGNELETGQSYHRSPSWTTAAKMGAVSSTHQSEVMPEPNEPVSAHQRQKSREQNGSERTVSEREETYQSWIPGQGAPSDSFFTAPIPPLRSAPPGPTPAGRPHVPGQNPWPVEAVPGSAVEHEERAGSEDVSRLSPQQEHPVVAARSETFRERVQEPLISEQAIESQTSAASGPQLVIGRIDVVVVADAKPARSLASGHTRSDSGFVSRNYLKRL